MNTTLPNKYVNKGGYRRSNGPFADTVTPKNKLAKGITEHDKSGAPKITHQHKDADTGDATAAVAEVLTGKTFYARGAKMISTMLRNGVGTRRDCARCWECL